MSTPCVTCGVPVEQPARGRRRVACCRAHRPSRTARHDERRRSVRPSRARAPADPLPVLYPELQTGTVVAFWEDELRLDLEQERQLAMLEGADVDDAVRRYQRRELLWRDLTRGLTPGTTR